MHFVLGPVDLLYPAALPVRNAVIYAKEDATEQANRCRQREKYPRGKRVRVRQLSAVPAFPWGGRAHMATDTTCTHLRCVTGC